MATEPARISGIFKLGSEYELDLRAYELRRSGRALKLERIPMELLILLVEHRGELVGRNQILSRIWGENVCLDADNSINAAIRKLRVALRDDPAKPHFIHTVTGKGYRFIAPVTETLSDPIPPAPLAPVVVTPQPVPPAPPVTEVSAPVPRRAQWPLFVSIAILASLAFIGLWRWSRSQARPSHPSGHVMLAVLPFQNLTHDPSQEYFTDGLTEEMISRMGDLDPQSFGVIAPSSVMPYKDTSVPIDQIARKLQVQYILQGSVTREAEQTRISVGLVSSADQAQLWTKSYAPGPADLLIIQADIASEVAAIVHEREGKTARPEKPASAITLTPEQTASHDLYLKGLYVWNKRTVPGLKQAVDYFQAAVDKDPNNARAYALMADCYALISGYDSSIPPRDVIPKAREAARRASELDPSLPEAHTALALIAQNYDWDWQTAESEYRRAIELNDSYATAHHWYGEMLGLEGRFDEAFRELDRALELDPLSLIVASDRGAILFYSRQYDRAMDQFHSVMEREPDFPRAHMIISVYMEKGLYREALTDLQQWDKRFGQSLWSLATAAGIYGRAGDSARATATVRKIEELSRRNPTDPAVLFAAYFGEGDRDRALQWLQKAYEAHSTSLTNLKVNPIYDSLRQEPRFQAVLRGMNLE